MSEKIAICAEKNDINSRVSMVVGRAPYFLVFEDGDLVEVIKNPFAVGGGGAGYGVSKMLSDKGVKLIVGARFGDKMIGMLSDRGINYKVVDPDLVSEVLKIL